MKTFRKLYWWLFIVAMSVRWIGKLNLMGLVHYQGETWRLLQGAADPYWDIYRGDKKLRVHRDSLKLVHTPSEWWFAFKSGYRFYMGYWFQIWVNNRPLFKMPERGRIFK